VRSSPTKGALKRKARVPLLGASYHYAGSTDFCIFNDDLHNRQVTGLLREAAPTIAFTHSPADYLLDYETTSTLVRNACFCAPVLNYETSQSGSMSHVGSGRLQCSPQKEGFRDVVGAIATLPVHPHIFQCEEAPVT
jgi:hypothetical protein